MKLQKDSPPEALVQNPLPDEDRGVRDVQLCVGAVSDELTGSQAHQLSAQSTQLVALKGQCRFLELIISVYNFTLLNSRPKDP